jgi:hypothetical protein
LHSRYTSGRFALRCWVRTASARRRPRSRPVSLPTTASIYFTRAFQCSDLPGRFLSSSLLSRPWRRYRCALACLPTRRCVSPPSLVSQRPRSSSSGSCVTSPVRPPHSARLSHSPSRRSRSCGPTRRSWSTWSRRASSRSCGRGSRGETPAGFRWRLLPSQPAHSGWPSRARRRGCTSSRSFSTARGTSCRASATGCGRGCLLGSGRSQGRP